MLVSNKKEQTADIHDNLNESQRNYAKWQKLNTSPKGLYNVFHKYNILSVTILYKQNDGCLVRNAEGVYSNLQVMKLYNSYTICLMLWKE